MQRLTLEEKGEIMVKLAKFGFSKTALATGFNISKEIVNKCMRIKLNTVSNSKTKDFEFFRIWSRRKYGRTAGSVRNKN